jgi:hypothetical protein
MNGDYFSRCLSRLRRNAGADVARGVRFEQLESH